MLLSGRTTRWRPVQLLICVIRSIGSLTKRKGRFAYIWKQRLVVVNLPYQSASASQCSEAGWSRDGLPNGTPYPVRNATPAPPISRQQRYLDLKAADKATGNYIAALEMRWKCRAGTCRNFGKCCFPFGNVDHVILTNKALIN